MNRIPVDSLNLYGPPARMARYQWVSLGACDVQLKFVGEISPAYSPGYATAGAAAIDLRACLEKPYQLRPGEQATVPLGIAIWIQDPNLAAVLLPRSGLGAKGLVLGNTVGLIDSDYQGELLACLWNRHEYQVQVIKPGDRICQLVFLPIRRPKLVVVEEFTANSERGTGGYGSTGVA